MLKLAVSGCRGRMGQRITHLALNQKKTFALTTLLEHKDHPEAKGDIQGITVTSDNTAIKEADVLIEFTLPDATIKNLQVCVENNIKMVIGTTGFTPEQLEEIKKASEKIPIVFASNMSVGVNILFKLSEIAAQKIGPAQINITEAHHIHKKDAPSGTAKTITEIAETASGQEIPTPESIREGEIIGDHEIIFETEYDTLKISHHAKNRDMFAEGALKAAVFLKNKNNGLYDMQQVLGLKEL